MMRGQKAIYNTLFPSSVTSETENKGKRNVAIDDRDDAMACRYYYHAQICRRRYDDCLIHLYQEFFITPNVITQRLAKRTDLIKELVKANTTSAELRKKYPQWAW